MRYWVGAHLISFHLRPLMTGVHVSTPLVSPSPTLCSRDAWAQPPSVSPCVGESCAGLPYVEDLELVTSRLLQTVPPRPLVCDTTVCAWVCAWHELLSSSWLDGDLQLFSKCRINDTSVQRKLWQFTSVEVCYPRLRIDSVHVGTFSNEHSS